MPKLTELKIKSLGDGSHGDGDGLTLLVRGDSRSWIYRYQRNGKRHNASLGTYPEITLKEARVRRAAAAVDLANGVDILAARKETKAAAIAAAKPGANTFDELAALCIADKAHGWKGGADSKHHQQWVNTIATYASPVIGGLQLPEIKVEHILDIMRPLWIAGDEGRVETATRLLGRIAQVIAYGKVRLALPLLVNVATYKGYLDQILPAPRSVAPREHFESLPYAEAPAFMRELSDKRGASALCLELLILTGVRSNEARGARWCEFDIPARLWTVPADRVKGRKANPKPHRVALSYAALRVLVKARRMQLDYGRESELVFPSSHKGTVLSDMTLTQQLRRMGKEYTAHGFRSTFTVWAAEQTEYPNELVELALGHTVGSSVEQAYRRTDQFEKRIALANDWAKYLRGK